MGSKRRALNAKSRSAPAAALPSWAPALGLVALATAWSGWHLIAFVSRHAVDCLYHDQWHFLTPLFTGRGAWACFIQQNGPHREGLGLLLTAGIYELTAWSSRAEAFCMVAILILAAAVAVAVAARLRGRLGLTDGAFVLLFLATAQFESIVVVPQVSHSVLPMLLIMLASAMLLLRDPVHRLAALAPLQFACTFTGFALFGAAAIALATAAHLALALRERSRRIALAAGLALAAAALTVALFFQDYQLDPALPDWRFPAAPLLDYLHFVAVLYANALGWHQPSPWGTAAGVVVAGLVAVATAWACWQCATARDEAGLGRWCAVAVPGLASLGFAVNAAIGRMPLGVYGAIASRYTSWALLGLAAVLLAGAAGAASSVSVRRVGAAVSLLVVVCLVTPPRWAELDAAYYATSKRRWVATYLRTGSVAAAQSARGVHFPAHPEPERIGLEGKLQFLRERRLNLFRHAPSWPETRRQVPAPR